MSIYGCDVWKAHDCPWRDHSSVSGPELLLVLPTGTTIEEALAAARSISPSRAIYGISLIGHAISMSDKLTKKEGHAWRLGHPWRQRRTVPL